jgi:hypothetical protein
MRDLSDRTAGTFRFLEKQSNLIEHSLFKVRRGRRKFVSPDMAVMRHGYHVGESSPYVSRESDLAAGPYHQKYGETDSGCEEMAQIS